MLRYVFQFVRLLHICMVNLLILIILFNTIRYIYRNLHINYEME